MKKLQTSLLIHAPADNVWRVLTNLQEYSSWNTFIPSITGALYVGGELTIILHAPGGKPTTIKPKLLKVQPATATQKGELRWRGTLPIPGLFTGEHYFILEPQAESKTLLIHGELFSGLLVNLVWKTWLQTTIRQGFETMNMALKARVEAL